MRYFILLLFFYFLIGDISAQEKKVMTAIINTSAECNSCKVRLEEKLNHISGIRFAELNLESKDLRVSYNSKKISLNKIRNIISQVGYNADNIIANPNSVKKLPDCCKPGGMNK